ncbi:IS66 family insertion sequence element accessory protein TnpB, partial [Hydrogenophaga sp. 2FB]|uniref:IS66 family insertion sequence element accessory protein TnpB n=1 Tax=Hydrogenophaga sp. 2FB TaxID=2502187 RepID=UPI0010F57C54
MARVVAVFGAARPHHAYLFANRRANRMKVLVHDGSGVMQAARRLNRGKFVWPRDAATIATLNCPGTATGSRARSGRLPLTEIRRTPLLCEVGTTLWNRHPGQDRRRAPTLLRIITA